MTYTLWVYFEPVEDEQKQWLEITDAVGRVSPSKVFGPEEDAFTWACSDVPKARVIANVLALPHVTRVSITER